MGRDAVGFHGPRRPHRRIGRVREHAQRVFALPAADEIVIRRAGHLLREERLELCRAESKNLSPRGKQVFVRIIVAGGDGREKALAAFDDAGAFLFEVGDEIRQGVHRKIGTARSDEPGSLPNDVIASRAIAGVGRGEVKDRVALVLEFHTHLVARNKGRDGLLP